MSKAVQRVLLKIMAGATFASSVVCFAETYQMDRPMPSEAHVLAMRSLAMRQVSVRTLAASENLIGSNSVLEARANKLKPWNDSFGYDLIQEISSELDSAGAYDEKSDTVLSGVLLENSIASTSGSEMNGRITVRLNLKRNGEVLFERVFSAQKAWRSPADDNRILRDAKAAYAELYKSISLQLILDPQFRSALTIH